MTPHELILLLADKVGPCMRLCAYCPDDLNTAEVKECVEKMYKEIYSLQNDKDELMKKIIKLRAAYRKETGNDYRDDL